MKKALIGVLCCMFIMLQYRLLQGEGSILDILRLNKAIEIEKDSIKKLTLRNLKLDAEIEALKLNPQALEERARTELGMIKKGEIFFLVVEPIR
jgi:cell division protein FtsB